MSKYHHIQLSKNYKLDREDGQPTNVLIFNETNREATIEWIKRAIEQNDGSFVVLDHNNEIYNATSDKLSKRNYYIENIEAGQSNAEISINPFDLATDLEKSHAIFSEIIHTMWDNDDKDIYIMSNLVDAFVSCMKLMFDTQPEKLTMTALKKMIGSLEATCVVNGESVPLSDAIFGNIKDQQSMPCKYYAMFKKAAGDREKEIANKVLSVFDQFTMFDINAMGSTDDVAEQLNFKTAFFINANNEREDKSCRLVFFMLSQLIKKLQNPGNVLFVVDDLKSSNRMMSLPSIIENANDNTSFIITVNNIASFMETKEFENYFRSLNERLYASILIHKTNSDDVDDCIATIVIPTEEVSDQDTVF